MLPITAFMCIFSNRGGSCYKSHKPIQKERLYVLINFSQINYTVTSSAYKVMLMKFLPIKLNTCC